MFITLYKKKRKKQKKSMFTTAIKPKRRRKKKEIKNWQAAQLHLVAKKVKRKYDNFVQIFLPTFFSNFLPNLERLCFAGIREKACGPHKNLSPFLPLTKQPQTPFSPYFSLLYVPSAL